MGKKILILTGAVAIAILYSYFGGHHMDERARKEYKQFNTASINHVILDIYPYARGVKLRFDNGEILFYPITSALNENNIFISTAKKGDRIMKKISQDTLTLIKNDGTMLKYTFSKPKQE